jgi:hypothetical protein
MQKKDMLEWAEHFVKHKDLVLRKIDSVSKSNGILIIKNKDKTTEQLIALESLSEIPAKLSSKTTIVIPNSKANFKKLIDNWSNLAQQAGLTIIFLNLKSFKEKKWIIRPFVHHRICDEQNLKKGLKSIYETVDPV